MALEGGADLQSLGCGFLGLTAILTVVLALGVRAWPDTMPSSRLFGGEVRYFHDIHKFLRYSLSSNMGEVFGIIPLQPEAWPQCINLLPGQIVCKSSREISSKSGTSLGEMPILFCGRVHRKRGFISALLIRSTTGGGVFESQ